MQMEFIRRMPQPQELMRDYPVSPELKQRKADRDREIREILTGKDDRFLLIVGPCSADREDAVLDYMHRLAELAGQVQERLMIIPRVYTNKPRTRGVGYKGMLHQPDVHREEDLLAGIIAIRQMHTRILRETRFEHSETPLSEGDAVINVGVSGPGVVKYALSQIPGADFETLCETIKKTAFKITRVGQLAAAEASKRLGVPFGIVDLSLAPTPAVGDSVADILEEMGLESVGAPGTTAALALLNDAVKKGGVMASSHVGGLSGAFIPVSEDAGMIAAAESGRLDITKLESMTAVCSVGLDMIVVPGDITPETISAIIADEAAIGMVNTKTTAVRLIPAIGKKAGERLEFGGLLGAGPVMPVREGSPEVFINRGGRIPAPLQALKN